MKCHIARAKENRGTVSGIIIKRCTNKTEFIIFRSFRFNFATPTFPAVLDNAEFSYTPLKDSHISSRFLASSFVAAPADPSSPATRSEVEKPARYRLLSVLETDSSLHSDSQYSEYHPGRREES